MGVEVGKNSADEFYKTHLSFALGELGLRLEEFWLMPWCEYLIKCYAWRRMDTNEWRRARMIAFNARIGSHLDPKRLPKTEHDFLPLDDSMKKTRRASPEAMEQLRKERADYELYRANKR